MLMYMGLKKVGIELIGSPVGSIPTLETKE
jgi:hypothetical protein